MVKKRRLIFVQWRTDKFLTRPFEDFIESSWHPRSHITEIWLFCSPLRTEIMFCTVEGNSQIPRPGMDVVAAYIILSITTNTVNMNETKNESK